MATNPYVNKVQKADGSVIIDLTADTLDASKVLQGYTGHDATGAPFTGTYIPTSGAISVVDTSDSHGGTVRTITALDISDTTAVASDVASGKYFYTADGTKTAGSASGGGGGLEYETGTWTPSENVAKPTISFTNTHTERPIYVLMSDTSETLYDSSSNSMLEWAIINWYDAFGFGMRVGDNQTNYARVQAIYRTSSFAASTYNPSNLNGNSSTNDMGYFLTNTAFYPYTGSNTRYWTAGRTYKWIAVWAPTT